MRLKEGDRVDRYVIVGPLGSGGMGDVYRARDTRLDRLIALKVLLPRDKEALGSDGASLGKRMLREAHAVAALDHPNVVAVYDVGEVAWEGVTLTYIAMELIHGAPLRAHVGDQSIPMGARVRWLLDVARALAAAHKAGIVHRDVKPENVMVRVDGVAKVLDFGIAKRAPAVMDTSIRTETAEGVRIGTPYYMAPEQMRGEAVDARADQFSWGVLAYELLVGRRPWSEDGDGVQLVAQILSKTADPPRAANPEVPEHVSEVVARTLAKSREDRFAAMDDVVAAIESEPDVFAPTISAIPVPRVRVSSPAIGEVVSPSPLSTTARANVTTAKKRRASLPELPPAKRRWVGVAAAGVLLVTAVGGGVKVWSGRQGAVARPIQASGRCASNAECTRASARPSRCRPSDNTCVALESDDCRVVADPGAAESDRTVWFGTMLPMRDKAFLDLGELDAVELARNEFMTLAKGLPAPDGFGPARPIGLVECDDVSNPKRAARHLADDVGVPGVIGFATSAEVLDIVPAVLIPARVVSLAVRNGSPVIAKIPEPADARYVWRPLITVGLGAQGVAHLVPQILEPMLHGSRAMRVALLEPDTVGGRSVADAIVETLRFNQKSAAANRHDFLQTLFSLDDVSKDPDLLARLLDFDADVVILSDTDEPVVSRFVLPLEARREARRTTRDRAPLYVVPDVIDPASLEPTLRRDPGLRRRIFGMYGPLDTPTNQEFTLHYNEHARHQASLASSPSAIYDAFYVLVYATYLATLNGEEPTGPAIARSIPSLSEGDPVGVGRSHILQAFGLLRRDRRMNLNGAATTLDFDRATGDVVADLVLQCFGVAPGSTGFEPQELGVRFDLKQEQWTGRLTCP